MVKSSNIRERENDILDLVVKSYISESKPISSTYLCERYRLPYSSATIRNVMESLEKKGLLSHVHTSSGRIPTKEGFRHYVSQLHQEDIVDEEFSVDLPFGSLPVKNVETIMEQTLDVLAQVSGYTSLVVVSGGGDSEDGEEKFFLRGTRFILEQPEFFEDIASLKMLFYVLEMKMAQLQQLLFHYLDDKVKILIGDDIGFEEISNCSLVVSGVRERDLAFVSGLLGPIRMDYAKATTCLWAVNNKLKTILREQL